MRLRAHGACVAPSGLPERRSDQPDGERVDRKDQFAHLLSVRVITGATRLRGRLPATRSALYIARP